MPSLNHVCRWNGTEWALVSPEEAIKEYPYGCPAERQQFMCALCGQYVSFVSGIAQDSHFRHSASEKSKDCLERTHAINLSAVDLACERHLPLKIVNVCSGNFSFALGFPKLPKVLFDHISMIHISGTGCRGESRSYSVERLAADRMTYLSVGGLPSAHYDIRVEGADASLCDYWPQKTRGVGRGTLFIKSSGRMLSPNSDVTVKETYYLLHDRSVLSPSSAISVKPVTHRYTVAATWRVYEVCAHSYTEEAARFFLGLEEYRLTMHPLSLQPIFPMCRMDDMNLYFSSEYLVFHMHGEGRVQTHPRVQITELPCDADSKLISLRMTEDHLRIVAGHMSALVEFDCWREAEPSAAKKPRVCVTDTAGAEIHSGTLEYLPCRALRISSPYDGRVLLHKDGVIAAQESLTKDGCLLWDRLSYGTELQVVIGCDTLWALRLERPRSQRAGQPEQELLYRLQRDRGRRIRTPYHLVRFLSVLREYPDLCAWIRRCMCKGWIGDRAYKKLRYFAEREREGDIV